MKIIVNIYILVVFLTLYILSGFSTASDTALTPRAKYTFEKSAANYQNKYWIYLDDSAIDEGKVLLSERSIQRRAKVDPVNFLIDEYDYAIKDKVINQIGQTGVYIRRVSKWLKAVSVEADSASVEILSDYPFVRKIDVVQTFKTVIDENVKKIDQKPQSKQLSPDENHVFDYGSSIKQNSVINAVKLHNAGLTGKGVIIALFDTGFEINHPAFDSLYIIAAYDFINNDTDVTGIDCDTTLAINRILRNQQSYHGTLTLGTISAFAPGVIIGVAIDASVVLAKTEISCNDAEIKIEEDNWIAAAEWADSIGVDIINSSLGYTEFDDSGSYTFEDLDGDTPLITAMADRAASKNILVVNSAGNERGNDWGHIVTPADGDSVLAVGAIINDSVLASFSSPGPTADGRIKPDIVAPGVNVISAMQGDTYAMVSGTSFSSPLTAGGAALAFEHDSTMTATELIELIHQTGDRSENPDNNFGYGVFNAAKAADIIKIDLPHNFQLEYGSNFQTTITTSGRTDSIPALTAFNLPSGITFFDNGDGTGDLTIYADSSTPALVSFDVLADIGYFVDTTEFKVTVISPSNALLTAGPNPFTDSVNIFINSDAGEVKVITIFSLAGEKIWEKVNNLAGNADEINVVQWDGCNQTGEDTAAGVYILTVVTDRQTFHFKLLKAK